MKNPKKKEEIQFENEVLKLQIQAESGVTMNTSDGLPPEIENQFMKNVLKFEQNYKDVTQIKIFDLLGKPVVKSIRSIPKDELKNEIDKLLDLYGEKAIAIDCLAEVSDRDFYKFLSKELMDHEVDDLKLEGWVTHFIYEEFHPNDDYDLRRLVDDFIGTVLSKSATEYYSMWIYDTVETNNGGKITSKKAVEMIEGFRNSFDRFSKPKIKIDELIFSKRKAKAKVRITYKAYPDNKPVSFDGDGLLKLTKKAGDTWEVSGISIPGFVI